MEGGACPPIFMDVLLRDSERVAFDIYFANLVGIRFHPRNDQDVDLDLWADVALEMILVRRRVFREA